MYQGLYRASIEWSDEILYAEPPSPSNIKVIVPIVVAVAAAISLAALAGYLTWRLRRKEPVSTALSRTALLKLSSSTRQDLEFEFQKGGLPVLIGKGGFGEVRDMTSTTSRNQLTIQCTA